MTRSARLLAGLLLPCLLGACSREEPEASPGPGGAGGAGVAEERADAPSRERTGPSPELQLALDDALKRADFASAAELVERGADVDFADEDGKRLVHAVCNPYSYRDPLGAARFLKKHGADLHAKSGENWPPIADAVWWGEVDLMEFLADNGADLHATQPGPVHRSEPGYTLLHIAALRSDPAALRWLLDRGLEVDARNADGDTPLLLAAGKGHAKVVELLLAAGADRSVVGRKGKTALQLARAGFERWKHDPANRGPREELVKLLEAGG